MYMQIKREFLSWNFFVSALEVVSLLSYKRLLPSAKILEVIHVVESDSSINLCNVAILWGIISYSWYCLWGI